MISTVILWSLVAVLGTLLIRRHPERWRKALGITLRRTPINLSIIAMAIVASGFLGEILPSEWIAHHIGTESGLRGILTASFAGGLLPGGPMVAFPLIITLARAGAGAPQVAALLAGWSVIALHRLLTWEVPMLGAPFAIRRILVSILLPPMIGLLAAGVIDLADLPHTIHPKFSLGAEAAAPAQ